VQRRVITSRMYRDNLYHASRQGFLIATFIILNVYLSTMRSWSLTSALVLLVAFALFELLALARK
jgi:hypothetical protein